MTRTSIDILTESLHADVSRLVSVIADSCPSVAPEASNLIDLCERAIDLTAPVDGRPIVECRAVSAWLAERLEAKGERVARDFGGLNIWARTGAMPAAFHPLVIEIVGAEIVAIMESGK